MTVIIQMNGFVKLTNLNMKLECVKQMKKMIKAINPLSQFSSMHTT